MAGRNVACAVLTIFVSVLHEMVGQRVSFLAVDRNPESFQRHWASIRSDDSEPHVVDALLADAEMQIRQVVPCMDFNWDGLRVFCNAGVIPHPTNGVLIFLLES